MELRGMPPSHMLINYPHIFPPLGTLQLLTIKAYGRRQVYIGILPIKHQILASSMSARLVEAVYIVESVSEIISLNDTPVGEKSYKY